MTLAVVTGTAVSDKTAAANWTIGAGAGFAITTVAGNVLLALIGKDNTSTAADGDNNEVTNLVDSVGNTYVKAKEFTNVQGGAAAGATVSLWYSVITVATTAATTTYTWSFASCTAKSAQLLKLTRDTTKTFAIDQTGTRADDGLDAGSISLTPGQGNIEYMFVRAIAHETASLTYLPTTNYTTFVACTGTTGGSDITNMAVGFEYRIFTTGSNEATDPTCTAVDHASVMVSFYEASTTSSLNRSVFSPLPFIPQGRNL